jgi:glycosyltransferase involved in cell wall biosynthesis
MKPPLKSAVVSFYTSYPPTCGAASVSFNVARGLPGERLLIQIETDHTSPYDVSGLPIIPLRVKDRSYVQKAFHLLCSLPRIDKALKRFSPRIVIMEGSSWSLYYLLFFLLIRFRMPSVLVVYHAHNVESLLRGEKNGRIVAALTRWSERKLIRQSDLATAVSAVDALQFERLYAKRPAVLPNGVDLESFPPVPRERLLAFRERHGLRGPTAFFMGLLDYPPNREALEFLVGRVFPLVLKGRPDARLVVAGGQAHLSLPWLVNPGVVPFEELPLWIGASDVCLAPIFSGSGTRLKILEYLASCRAVVSTTKGAEGLDVRPGEDLLIADGAGAFADAILALIEHPERARALGESGRRRVEQLYAWPSLIRAFLELIPETRGAGSPSRDGRPGSFPSP